MNFIFTSDSDEETIVEFVKQNKELYDKTQNPKTSRGSNVHWERLAGN